MPVRGFLIILVCVVSGVVLGFGVGFLLGTLALDFGTVLFGNYNRESGSSSYHFDGKQIGIGLGVANGVWVGLIAGIALVIAEAVKSLKKPARTPPPVI